MFNQKKKEEKQLTREEVIDNFFRKKYRLCTNCFDYNLSEEQAAEMRKEIDKYIKKHTDRTPPEGERLPKEV